MADLRTSVNPLFLREEELRKGLDLLFHAQRAFVSRADPVLAAHGLGHAHHRALYFIARRGQVGVGDLVQTLGITKQSLGRVIDGLIEKGLVQARPGDTDRRRRMLSLTADGTRIEAELFACQREALAWAYRMAGAVSVEGFRQVLTALVDGPSQAPARTGGTPGDTGRKP